MGVAKHSRFVARKHIWLCFCNTKLPTFFHLIAQRTRNLPCAVCMHICAINRVQMCRNQRVRFYPAAHDRLYLAVISGRYNRPNTGYRGSGYNRSFYSQQLYPLSRTNGYNRFDLRLYIPACIHATAHVCMLFCLLVHLCSCVSNHPRASTC